VLPVIVGIAVFFFLEGKREEGIFLEGKRGTKIFLDGKRGSTLAFCCGAAASAALGLLLSKQILPLPLSPNPSLRLQRAYVADVYFEQRGALEEEIARTGVPQPRLLARRQRELALPPPAWPLGANRPH
jgi:hypothetical protein